jgi:hypothetical protein
MAEGLKRGDKVSWDTAQGTTQGKVVKQLTATTRIKGHVAKPTNEDPQFLVRSDKKGAEAAHKPEALKRRR